MGKTVFTEGETFDLTLESDKGATLLLVSIDVQGDINTITLPIVAGARVTLPQSGTALAPFGTDILKLFAFPHPPPGLERYRQRDLNPTGAEIQALLALIRSASGWAETQREIVTVPRP